MKKSLTVSIAALVVTVSSSLAVQGQSTQTDPLEEARDVVSNWVKVRSTYATEKNNWRTEKELLKHRIELLKEEISSLEEQITEAEEGSTEATQKRMKFADQEKELREANKVVAQVVSFYEKDLREISNYLPAPLEDKLRPLIGSLPKPGKKTNMSAGQRIALIVGILNEIDKFNNVVTISKETRNVGGANAQVKTLYFGLGMAIYADETAENAGIGYPAEGGWVWEERNDKAPDLFRAIGVAEGSIKPAEFVNIELLIKDVL